MYNVMCNITDSVEQSPFKMLIVVKAASKSTACEDPQGSLLYAEELAAEPYRQLHESSLHSHAIFL